jgi:hypothetical protein
MSANNRLAKRKWLERLENAKKRRDFGISFSFSICHFSFFFKALSLSFYPMSLHLIHFLLDDSLFTPLF